MKFKTQRIQRGVWPATVDCLACDRPAKPHDVVTYRDFRGDPVDYRTVLFHRNCFMEIANQEFPGSMFDDIKSHLVETGSLDGFNFD